VDPVTLATLGGIAYANHRINAAVIKRFTYSRTAVATGTDNTPDTPEDLQRLLWLASMEPKILAAVRTVHPGAFTSNVYRSDLLNIVLRQHGYATAKHSRHLYGLGLDVAWKGISAGPTLDAGLRAVRDAIAGIGAELRDAIAEHDNPHLHFDFFDPLRLIDKRTRATRWKQKRADKSWHTLNW